ncbi:hypothetical protein IQ254_28000 [Nodosilinea sp. LEGE 07088]|nr:hypothetical protein [Nodosilinea sp. LEGE 07088]
MTTCLLRIWVCLTVLGWGQRAIAQPISPCVRAFSWNAPPPPASVVGDAIDLCATHQPSEFSTVNFASVEFSPAAAQPEVLALDAEAIAPTLDLDPAVIENSPVLQRWLEQVPDVANEIRHQPSFRTRLRVGYAQFSSTGQISGVGAAVEDVFVVRGTGLTASAAYNRSWNGQREDYGGEVRYYLLPLGGYVNIAPTIGYRSLSTPDYQTHGLDVGLRLMLIPSRGGGADLALSQRWVAPGNEGEVGITSLAIGYAVTRQLRLGTDFQLQNSRFGQDSRFGLSLELLL